MKPTKTDLIDRPWRIYSMAFNVLRPEGYPVTFVADGRFESPNWKISSHWSLGDDGDLELTDDYKQMIAFVYDGGSGVYVAYHSEPTRYVYALIGPEGTDFGRVQAALAARLSSQHAPN